MPGSQSQGDHLKISEERKLFVDDFINSGYKVRKKKKELMDSGEHTASRSQDEAPQEKSLPQQAFG